MVSICYVGFEGIHVIISGHGMSKLKQVVGAPKIHGALKKRSKKARLEKETHLQLTWPSWLTGFKLLGIPYLFGENKVRSFISGSIG